MYAVTVFLFLIGLIAIWALGTFIYQNSYLGKLSKDANLPAWEHLLYYIIAIYPFVGYVLMMKASGWVLQVQLPDSTILTYKLLFTIGHIALSVLSVAIIRYLLKRSRWHIPFALSTVFAGSIFFTGTIMFMIIAK